jgi:acetyl-CoA acetyltransferase
MTEAVIVSTARTGLAKSWRGAFNMTHGATLGGHVTQAAVARAGIDPARVEDVIMGCANPEGATGANIARQIALRAGLPVTVPGMTVNRFCSSGLQTIALAAQRVIAGEGDVYVAGGVESISCVQNEMNRHMLAEGWLMEHKPEIYWSMLQTAETVAKRYEISRERQDEYGAQSQQRAAAAQAAGRFDAEIAFITTHAEAPSENWLALPAVITPPGIAVRIFDTPSSVVSARMPSSAASVTSLVNMRPVALSATPANTVIGTISASNRPAACAAAARCCDCAPYSSCRSLEIS